MKILDISAKWEAWINSWKSRFREKLVVRDEVDANDYAKIWVYIFLETITEGTDAIKILFSICDTGQQTLVLLKDFLCFLFSYLDALIIYSLNIFWFSSLTISKQLCALPLHVHSA